MTDSAFVQKGNILVSYPASKFGLSEVLSRKLVSYEKGCRGNVIESWEKDVETAAIAIRAEIYMNGFSAKPVHLTTNQEDRIFEIAGNVIGSGILLSGSFKVDRTLLPSGDKRATYKVDDFWAPETLAAKVSRGGEVSMQWGSSGISKDTDPVQAVRNLAMAMLHAADWAEQERSDNDG